MCLWISVGVLLLLAVVSIYLDLTQTGDKFGGSGGRNGRILSDVRKHW